MTVVVNMRRFVLENIIPAILEDNERKKIWESCSFEQQERITFLYIDKAAKLTSDMIVEIKDNFMKTVKQID